MAYNRTVVIQIICPQNIIMHTSHTICKFKTGSANASTVLFPPNGSQRCLVMVAQSNTTECWSSFLSGQWFILSFRLWLKSVIRLVIGCSKPLPTIHREAVCKDGAEIPSGDHCQCILRPHCIFNVRLRV